MEAALFVYHFYTRFRWPERDFDMYETGKILLVIVFVIPFIGYFRMSVNDSDPTPCGACGFEVTDTGILCDTCSQWYHPI